MLKKRAACKSPYLARVLEIGTVPDTSHPYWVCALDLGSKFDELLNEQYRSDRICRLLRQVAIGISVLHRNDVYHGDIRAGNVWVRLNGDEEEAFLVGVAIDQWANLISSPSPMLEQARYMAPERTMGEPSSKSSDIYAFAVLVYRSLSGSYPFDGTESFSISASHATEPVPVPIPPFDEALWQMLLECLAKDPTARPTSLDPFIEILGGYEYGTHSVHKEKLRELSSEEEPTPAISMKKSLFEENTSSSDIEMGSREEAGRSISGFSDMEEVVEEELGTFNFSEAQPSFSESGRDVSFQDSPEEESLHIPPIVPESSPVERTDWAIHQKETTQEVLAAPLMAESPVVEELISEESAQPSDHMEATAEVSESEHTQTDALQPIDDLESETIYTVENSSSENSQAYSGFEPDTLEYTEGSEDITVVPVRVHLPKMDVTKEDLQVPNIAISIVSPPEEPPQPPKVILDDISPLAKADITENEEEYEEPELTGSIDVDVKKYVLIFLACFTVTILIMYLLS
jgi:serine/threonine protein kinase